MISQIKLFNKNFLLLRDDLLGEINGNKARKLDFIKEINLPYKNIICYGSSQSNAMQALALFCNKSNYNFTFVCARECDITGNLADAINNNAKIIYSNKFYKTPKELAYELYKNDKESFLIDEGVCNDFARFGFFKMAKELAIVAKEIDFDVFLPSGTYTSAIYLEKYLRIFCPNINVYTCACVSADEYFKKQVKLLNPNSALKLLKTKKKYHFAKLYEELFVMIENIDKIDFELLYDSVGMIAIYENLDILKENILYIHQGGLLGSSTLKERYLRHFKAKYNFSEI